MDMMSKIVAACLGCGCMIDLKADAQHFQTQRCAACRGEQALMGKFGSLIVEGAMTQRELAELKREFYELYTIDASLKRRQAEFMARAQAEMEKVVADIEAEIGQPVKALRMRKQQLEARLQAYMEESHNNEMVIKDLLVELQNQMTNRGNMPQYKQIVDDLRALLKWTEEEMETFVKARYSEPQYADVMTVKPLPPGRRKLRKMQQGGPTASRTAATPLAETILKTHEKDGGATFGMDGQNMVGRPGFAVPLFPERSIVLSRTPSADDIETFIDRNADLFADRRAKIGTWFDRATGEHVLDVIAVFPDRETAIDLGRKYNQKAIFDLQALQEIPTGGSGTPPAEQLPSAPERFPALNPVEDAEQVAQPDRVHDGDVVAYAIPAMTLPGLAVIHEDFVRTGATICKVETPQSVFILTGEKVRQYGLHQMIAIQAQTKQALRVADMEHKADSIMVLIEGPYVSDPNTVRAFLAERVDDHEIADVYFPDDTHVAVEMRPAVHKRAEDPTARAMAYFDGLDGVLSQLSALERQRGQKAHEMVGQTEAANQMDTGDNIEDLSLKYERHNVGGDSYGDGTKADGGIMTPDSTNPNPAVGG